MTQNKIEEVVEENAFYSLAELTKIMTILKAMETDLYMGEEDLNEDDVEFHIGFRDNNSVIIGVDCSKFAAVYKIKRDEVENYSFPLYAKNAVQDLLVPIECRFKNLKHLSTSTYQFKEDEDER